LVIDPAFFGIVSESFFSFRFMIAAATHRNGVATITTTVGDGRMSRSISSEGFKSWAVFHAIRGLRGMLQSR
jgi:hypothetical protein